VLDLIPDDGTTKVVHHLGRSIDKEERWSKVMADMDGADTIILTFPLYWDATPSHTTRAMEMIATHRRKVPPTRPQSLVFIVNNGFPEPWHNQVALRICRRFAEETGYTWGGGLNVAGGAAVDGRPLEEVGIMKGLLKGLEKAALPIAAGDPVPEDIEDAVGQQNWPPWIQLVFGGMGVRYEARRSGSSGHTKDRPYK